MKASWLSGKHEGIISWADSEIAEDKPKSLYFEWRMKA